MKKIAKVLASFAALAFVVAPAVPASAYSEGVSVDADGKIVVSTEADLQEAFLDEDATYIELGGDITVHRSLVITRPLALNGKHHTITMADVADRVQSDSYGQQADSYYVLKVYNQPTASTSIQDVVLNGGVGGLQNNGSHVTVVDVTFQNHEWGGMEITKGENVATNPITDFYGKVNYADESGSRPAIWTDGIAAENVKLNVPSAEAAIVKNQGATGQVQFFTSAANAEEALKDTTNYAPLDETKYPGVEFGSATETPGDDTGDDTDTDTPEVTEPVKDKESTDKADVTAPNTGTTIRFASAKK